MDSRLPDPRFPVPKPPAKPAGSLRKSQFYSEIDISAGRCVMNDGRPALIENWLDCDTEFFCRTVYYSTLDAEEWDERRHYEFLKESGLLKDKTYTMESSGFKRIEDNEGQGWWVVTVPICDDGN
jgi:hypothetical protein